MRMSWKLGRILGIEIYVHPTFMMLLAYIALFEGGVVNALLVSAVFGCVLLHELGHALTARRFGIETVDITLYPIGGVARLARMPRAPGAEMLVALAGPAVNVVIFGVLTTLLSVLPAGTGHVDELIVGFVATLAQINLMLALFNLIPAFPMDGGRVLRALLSSKLGRVRATLVASTLGRVLALVAGLYFVTHGAILQVFLAMFIYLAAQQELAQVIHEERRREHDTHGWAPPAGFRWVNVGHGVWQLAPLDVATAATPPFAQSVEPRNNTW